MSRPVIVTCALTGDSDIASQFDSFTRRIVDPESAAAPQTAKKTRLGIERIASMW